jgi:hypothetical protein
MKFTTKIKLLGLSLKLVSTMAINFTLCIISIQILIQIVVFTALTPAEHSKEKLILKLIAYVNDHINSSSYMVVDGKQNNVDRLKLATSIKQSFT